jgi:hypothetical protein
LSLAFTLGLPCADLPQNSRLSDSMSASCTRAMYTNGQRLGYEGMMKWNITTHYLENGLGAFSLPSSIVSTPSTPWLDHRIEVVQHGARPRRRQPSTWKNRVGSINTIFLSWAWRWSRCWACWWMLFPRYTPRSISLCGEKMDCRIRWVARARLCVLLEFLAADGWDPHDMNQGDAVECRDNMAF